MAKQTNTKQTKTIRVPTPATGDASATDLATSLVETPLTLMKRFGEEMDRLFSDSGVGRGWINSITGRDAGEGLWAPEMEMFERDGELVVRADLPGLTKDDVNIELSDGNVTIEGERRGEREEKREGFYRSERSYGKFYRQLPLPDGVNVQDANATFRNGVLEITMEAPRRSEAKKRRLSITDESQPKAKGKAA